jgi:hypothetical protein
VLRCGFSALWALASFAARVAVVVAGLIWLVDKLRGDCRHDLRRQQEQLLRDLSQRAGELLAASEGMFNGPASKTVYSGISRKIAGKCGELGASPGP